MEPLTKMVDGITPVWYTPWYTKYDGTLHSQKIPWYYHGTMSKKCVLPLLMTGKANLNPVSPGANFPATFLIQIMLTNCVPDTRQH